MIRTLDYIKIHAQYRHGIASSVNRARTSASQHLQSEVQSSAHLICIESLAGAFFLCDSLASPPDS